ncbi:MAG: ABC transporter ATP-binding protein [Caldilineaceae bacterium]|nr:ABC transporter ATP-binding protein [Caldilineaceae bacterium]MBP8110437.1 ABC transporter ATP-binding protein [Caldilineaceae bacterium]MBP8123661.1 ABC transporter ATP-binding protein [Caldilineaceae bacterium]MBP9073101.1 ABC transporter ATP-binding protein [Caldilineaceae bacterium]
MQREPSRIAIHAQNLTRNFGEIRAVADLCLETERGKVFGFLGPNGAGKTTTIRLLLGLLAPSSGSAQVLGYDLATQADEIRRRTGVLLEHTGLYERLSAQDNLDLYARIWHLPAPERTARIRDLLTHLDLWDRRQEQVGKWSRGMKQKLAVARTLLHHPALIFLDEPTAGLDPVAAAALRKDLAGLARQEGVAIFLTTHNLAEAEELCHQVGVINQGRLLALGTPAQLQAQRDQPRLTVIGRGFTPAVVDLLCERAEVAAAHLLPSSDLPLGPTQSLMVELAGKVDTAPIVSLLVESGVEIEEIRKDRASLSDVFMDLVADTH